MLRPTKDSLERSSHQSDHWHTWIIDHSQLLTGRVQTIKICWVIASDSGRSVWAKSTANCKPRPARDQNIPGSPPFLFNFREGRAWCEATHFMRFHSVSKYKSVTRRPLHKLSLSIHNWNSINAKCSTNRHGQSKRMIPSRLWALLNNSKHIEATFLPILTIWLCLQPP